MPNKDKYQKICVVKNLKLR